MLTVACVCPGEKSLPASEPPIIPDDACEYLVKWKGRSYIHVEWVPATRVLAEGVPGRAKINRFLKAQQKKARRPHVNSSHLVLPAWVYFCDRFCRASTTKTQRSRPSGPWWSES